MIKMKRLSITEAALHFQDATASGAHAGIPVRPAMFAIASLLHAVCAHILPQVISRELLETIFAASVTRGTADDHSTGIQSLKALVSLSASNAMLTIFTTMAPSLPVAIWLSFP